MGWDERVIEAAARRAYERGRLLRALRWLPIGPLALLAAWPHSPHPGLACVLAVAAAGVSVWADWRGEGWRQGVAPGVIAGWIALSVPTASHILRVSCLGGGCQSFCVLACGVAGLIGGGIVAAWRPHARHRQQLRSSILVAALLGTMGCLTVGGIGAMLMILTLAGSGALLGRAPALAQ